MVSQIIFDSMRFFSVSMQTQKFKALTKYQIFHQLCSRYYNLYLLKYKYHKNIYENHPVHNQLRRSNQGYYSFTTPVLKSSASLRHVYTGLIIFILWRLIRLQLLLQLILGALHVEDGSKCTE